MQKQFLFHLIITFFLSFSGGPTFAQGSTFTSAPSAMTKADSIGSQLSLPQAVSIAIRNNLNVNTYDLYLQQDKIYMNQSWQNMLPTLNASASQNLGFGRVLNSANYTYINQQTASGNYQLSTSVPLFKGFYLQNTIRENTYLYHAGKMDLQYQKDHITLGIILDYLTVLSSQDQLRITREQAVVDSVLLGRLITLSKEGWTATSTISDLPTLQGQYASDLANIAAADNTFELAKVNLFADLNVPYKRDVELDRGALVMQLTDYQQTPDSIFQTALGLVPQVKAADLRVQAYQKYLQAQRGLYYPTLSFSGSINTYYNNATPEAFKDQFNNNQSTSLGLTLSIPILNNFQVRNNVKLAKIALRSYELQANNTKLLLQQSVESAYQNMIQAYRTYKADIDQAAAFADALRITETRFKEGVAGVDANIYLPAKRLADQADLSLILAKYTYIFRTKVLDYYQGKLNLQ
ncbi:MAG: TolC family protein [Puia sp.]|nr:TolC family protein [Puia sp.]